MLLRRLTASFEGLDNSLVQSPGKLWIAKWHENSSSMQDVEVQYICSYTLVLKVLMRKPVPGMITNASCP